ncbi:MULTISPECIES: GAF domain-containing sensor histidine kinase [Micromonospora]|uniref:ATPase n=1 Tax=Micromonospora solifontis TaxID=2487138 RepID=A0ABX9WDW8_9ACTN|nr:MULTISPECIES: GAF domain-containing sensor histidine kinase [Micromonospora]NES12330.1 GAF domain-containing sensor histidine kinase [Micromonospora sp. PPF5-17B]NES37767.1 GAF domain-containing sensor histidine kinase [Micromonospora solifontis]NES54187.1 GAF domain-containing sensor histidine kinase [Micromonospora sp. PPF5-6]RNL97963.1 ATPase [Micromonospora solifontis]
MPASTASQPQTQPLAAAARLVLLALVAALTLFATGEPAQLWWIALLGVAGLPAVLAPQHRLLGLLSRFAEVVVLGLAASQVAADTHLTGVTGGLGASAVLPYLAVPVTVTALRRRYREGAALLAVAAATLLVSAAFTEVDGGRQLGQLGYLAVCAQWLILAGLGLYTAGTFQRVVRVRGEKPQPYAEATRLLTQLRTVARQLPGATLDPGGISEHLLEELRMVAKTDRGAVLSASGGGRLVVLAQIGVDRVDWETTLDADSAIADAWASQQPQTSSRSQARSQHSGEVSALIVPLVAGVRTVGLVVIEADTPHAYPPAVMSRVTALTGPAALRLEAALLFDEVRSLATNEERQRLAREIHDGVAQELVMVGYGIDNALATVHDDAEETADSLRTLRQEVTRVITELRLSLFELRSEVDRHGGLAAAIAEYARTVGASGGLRVHLSLDESTARLPAATEAELLRIAQEAVTNARKHAGASNLWVTCEVDPPYAQIEVSDDGHGIGDQRPDGHYGLAIMAERAERIRGRLEIRPRQPSGTTVAVVLGSSPRRDKVRGSAAAAEGE